MIRSEEGEGVWVLGRGSAWGCRDLGGTSLVRRWIMRKPLKSFDQDSGKFRFVLLVKSA